MLNKRFRYSVLLCITVVISIIHVYPHYAFQQDLGSRHRGLLMLGSPDEENYVLPLKQIYEGNYSIGNSVIYEHKSMPNGFIDWIPEILLGSLSKLVGIPLFSSIILMDAFLPGIIFILFFILTYLLSRHWWIAMLIAVWCVMSPFDLWGFSNILKPYIGIASPYFFAFLPFSRLINPQFTIIPVLLFLITFHYGLTKPTLRKALLAGFLLASNVYFYIFWLYLYPFIGFILCVSLLFKDKTVFTWTLFVFLFSFLFLLPGLPLLIQAKMGEQSLMMSPFVIAHTHRLIFTVPVLINIFLGIFLLLLMVMSRKKRKLKYLFALSLCVGGIVTMNQQFITGKIAQPHHYDLFINPMLSLVALATIAAELYDQFIKNKHSFYFRAMGIIVWSVLCLYSFAEGMSFQHYSYSFIKPFYEAKQSLMGPITWINQHASNGVVVFTDLHNVTAEQISIYSQANTYVSLNGRFYHVPDTKEFTDRLLNYALVLGLSVEQFQEEIGDYGKLHFMFFGFRYFAIQPKDNYFTYNVEPFLSPTVKTDLVKQYQEKLKRPILAEIKKYRIDYILYGPIWRPDFIINPELMPFLTEVYKDVNYIIYKIK